MHVKQLSLTMSTTLLGNQGLRPCTNVLGQDAERRPDFRPEPSRGSEQQLLARLQGDAFHGAARRQRRPNGRAAGSKVLRGGCQAYIGLFKLMRHEYAGGLWYVSSAWMLVRHISTDALLHYEGFERSELRSASRPSGRIAARRGWLDPR